MEKKAVLKGECGPLAAHWRLTGGSLRLFSKRIPSGPGRVTRVTEAVLKAFYGKKSCFEGGSGLTGGRTGRTGGLTGPVLKAKSI